MGDVLALDTVVIGAGVVGLAIGRALALAGREVTVVEAEPLIGSVTSSRNSEVIHAGLYYPTGSLKARLCVAGRDALYAYCAARGIPHRRCGKLVVAANEGEAGYLEKLHEQAEANGVMDCRLIDGKELARLEPEIRGAAALLSPSTGIVDSHACMAALRDDIEAAGGSVVTRTPVLGGSLESDVARLSLGGRDPVEVEARAWSSTRPGSAPGTSRAPLRVWLRRPSRRAISPRAATFRWRVARRRHDWSIPCRSRADWVSISRSISPARHATAPSVEWTDSIDYTVDPRRSQSFYAAIRRYWPGLADGALIPAYSGVRPKIAGPDGAGDFVIQVPRHRPSGLHRALRHRVPA